MSPEELDEARAKEALRIWNEEDGVTDEGHAVIAARLARENWTPPEPVDPDVLAFREWFAQRAGSGRKSGILAGHWDSISDADAYLAGASMATKRERERAKVLVECVERYAGPHGAVALAKYNGEW